MSNPDEGAGGRLNDATAAEIRALLARRQVRQSKFAEMVGESEVWVSRRLRGIRVMTLNDLDRIAVALGVKVTDLLPIEVR